MRRMSIEAVPPGQAGLRPWLRCGASLAALVAAAAPAQAHTAFRSINQALAAAGGASQARGAAVQNPSQAAAAGVANLLAAGARFRSLAQSLAAASVSAAVPANLPAPGDGLALRGLNPAAAPGTPLWRNAGAPVASPAANGRTTVTVQQTAATAVLTWNSFNVSARTNLVFNQGAASWVVLNRVEDPSGDPSQILGSISAPGQVYIINRNGVLFGHGAQVDLRSLIASTADIDTTSFLANGIFSPNATTAAFATAPGATAAGSIIVDPGAVITTAQPASVTDGGGFVLLMGSAVSNAGSISTPGGQAALAAGAGFILLPGYGTNGDSRTSVQGIEVAVAPILNGAGKTIAYGGGTAANTGVLMAQDGDVTMVGHSVVQDGAIISSTGVGQRGTVHLLTDLLDTGASVTLGPDSVTEILPDQSSATALQALRSSTAGTASSQLNDLSGLPDVADLSRIEITSGRLVDFTSGALVLAPGGQIAIDVPNGQKTVTNRGQTLTAFAGTVFAGQGAVLDVSGLSGVTLPMSANLFPVSIEPYNLRDSPVNRDTGNLNSTSIEVDARTLLYVPPENGDTSARYYTGGGLLEVGGELGNVGYTISQYLTQAGIITVSAASLVAQTGSVFDIAGGSELFQGGAVKQTYLKAADGSVVNLNVASDTEVYTGIYTGDVVDHTRWKVTDSYVNPLLTPAFIDQPGYSVGGNAGGLQISAPTIAFDGTLDAGVTPGPYQNHAPIPGNNAPLATENVVPLAGTLAIAPVLASPFATTVTITPDLPTAADRLTASSRLPKALENTADLGAGTIDSAGLGAFIVAENADIAVDAPLSVAALGTIALSGGYIDVSAPLTAPGGSIMLGNVATIRGSRDILVGAKHAPGVVVQPGVVVNAEGSWANAIQAPSDIAGEASDNGGTVAIATTGNIGLESGSVITVSAGGYVTTKGTVTGGNGGNITLTSADPFGGIPSENASHGLTLAGTLDGYGFGHGGTLALATTGIVIGNPQAPLSAAGTVSTDLPTALFSTGFADYVVSSNTNLVVEPGTDLAVTEPVLSPSASASALPVGSDAALAFTIVLPPLFTALPVSRVIQQRAGASLTLDALGEVAPGRPSAGKLTLSDGASITVDPSQSVTLQSTNTETIAGTITAHGGSVAVLDGQAAGIDNQLWIGPQAVIDVSGLAATADDPGGNPFGTVLAGGTITLGATPGEGGSGLINASGAPIVIRSGALLDASGADTAIALAPATNGPLLAAGMLADDATAGGDIYLASIAGLFIDGTLKAPGGDASAPGGTLSLNLETEIFGGLPPSTKPGEQRYLKTRVLTVTSTAAPTLPGDDAPNAVAAPIGVAVVSTQAITAGGFGSVSLFARDAIDFRGDVTLAAAQGIVLRSQALADSKAGSTVTVSAAAVELYAPDPWQAQENQYLPYQGVSDLHATGSTLNIDGGLIDIRGNNQISSTGTVESAHTPVVSYGGFSQLNLDSTGDIRLLGGGLSTPFNLSVQAAQIYPITGVIGTLSAGYGEDTQNRQTAGDTKAVLSISGIPGDVPAPPLSVFGTLVLDAPVIDQGGIVRAPLGAITLGDDISLYSQKTGFSYIETSQLSLLPGSVTSVSAEGQTIPYGGTEDGQTYLYNSNAVTFNYSAQGGSGGLSYGILLQSRSVSIAAGATLDLDGGGDVTGEAFVSGRGGSTDTLITPLLGFNPAAHSVSAPTLTSGDAIYALVPSLGAGPVPLTPLDMGSGYTGSVPAKGASISVGAGVPGLPAGTYTLLPSYYALLPGAFRVELRGGLGGPQAPVALPDGTYALSAVRLTDGLPSGGGLPVQALITPAATITRYSTYNQEGYAAFALAQPSVALFGDLRPHLPADASSLALSFFPALPGVASLLNQGTTLFAPAAGGLGGDVSVYTQSNNIGTLNLLIAPAASASAPAGSAQASRSDVVLTADGLDAFDAARLDIGGFLSIGDGAGLKTPAFAVTSTNVTIATGATLSAPAVFIGAADDVTVQSGAVIDTRGQAGSLLDSSTGLIFQVDDYRAGHAALLAVANGLFRFAQPYAVTDPYPITISSGATLYTDGTIAAVTPGPVVISPSAVIGAQTLGLAVTSIDVGDPAAIAASGLQGVVLSQAVLNTLLAGNPAAGIPALQELDLTALQSLNFFGTTALNTIDPATGKSRLNLFVLNTPGIYGIGGAGDVASLTVGTLYWNGAVQISDVNGPTVIVPQPPPFAIAGGPGTGTGTLDITAQALILGQGPNDTPNQFASERAIFGFGNVNLTASQFIEGTGQGSLQVYESQGPVHSVQGISLFTGTGGQLAITTPLLTGGAGSTLSITAGGVLTLAAPGPAGAAPPAAGATLLIDAASIADTGTIVLPSGRLDLDAAGDIDIQRTASINVAGAATPVFDQTVSAPGGVVNLASATGNISMAAGSSLALGGAGGQAAGTLTVQAAAGTATLLGSITTAGPDAAQSGAISVWAQAVPNFAALNQALTADGLFGSRSFEIGTGGLTIETADQLRASTISVSLDGGALTIDGLADASGPTVGSISLAGASGLSLTSQAVLDASATGPAVIDSYGNPIDALNRAEIALTSAAGTLAIAPGASLRLDAGGGLVLGDLELNAPRNPAILGDVEVSAPKAALPITISGAATIALNAFRSYTQTLAAGQTIITIDQATLDRIEPDSVNFENAALADKALQTRIAALTGTAAFHLRPGIILQSSSDIDVLGDITLANYRYGPGATGNGAGEPGVLVLRTGGNLTIAGSISDGFEAPPASPDDTGWVVFNGSVTGATQPVVLDTRATLALSTQFQPDDGALAYPLHLAAGGQINPGYILPVAVTLQGSVLLSQAWATPSAISVDGMIRYPAGALIPAGTRLPNGAVLAAGGALPVTFTIGKVVWPAGADLAAFGAVPLLSQVAKLAPGDTIPGDASPVFVNAVKDNPNHYVPTRPGGSGSIDALATLLPAGSLSWTIDLVAGANLGGASLTAVLPPASLSAEGADAVAGTGSTGNLVLDDAHYASPVLFDRCEIDFGCYSEAAVFSVIRTGTGGLTLDAGGSILQLTPYGIYTAGTQSAPILDASGQNPYATAPISTEGLSGAPTYQAVIAAQLAAGYQPYYPTDGGNLTVSAAGNIAQYTNLLASATWLYGLAGPDTPTSWWVNFGTYFEQNARAGSGPLTNPETLVGAIGFGTYGGGNVLITAGGDAGTAFTQGSATDGFTVTVGSTGRVTSISTVGATVVGGTVAETGGGNITIDIGGAINPNPGYNTQAGVITDTRGTITVAAGAVGQVAPVTSALYGDPRIIADPSNAESADSSGGLLIQTGDSSASIITRSDLVVTGAVPLAVNLDLNGFGGLFTPGLGYDVPGNFIFLGGYDGQSAANMLSGGFWLGQPNSGTRLLSEGGNLSPFSGLGAVMYTPSFTADAPYGSIYFSPTSQNALAELAPSPTGSLSLIAGNAIYGYSYSYLTETSQTAITQSGAAYSVDGLANPFHAVWQIVNDGNVGLEATNQTETYSTNFSLFAFEPDTPAGPSHPLGSPPEIIYAGTDIVDLGLGSVIGASGSGGINNTIPWYTAAQPVDIRAGRDIVGLFGLIVNDYATDVSTVEAGRDLIFTNLQVAGPGNLLLEAGRNVYQANGGVNAGPDGVSVTSLGLLAVDPSASSAGRSGGAGITVLAGLGAEGPDWTAFADAYLNDANQANPQFTLTDPQNAGKVVQTYGAALLAWLQQNYGYTGDQADALPAFLALSSAVQSTFLLPIYFDELRLSGREETDPTSRFFHSYERGREAIAILFPAKDYQGDITLFGGSGIQTQFGGDITLVAPGGATTLGIESNAVPPSSAGLITFGQGNVDIYGLGSVELGQSRVFTTFGGGITIWSATGDINAGRGAKSTVVAQPFQLSYDPFANITLSPSVPTTGAGIATLNEIPGTEPGDVDLIAPVGTIDAGEAGIRASGNANLAARIILNAANIQVQGKTTGVPTFVTASAASEAAASAGAGAAAQAATLVRRMAPTPSPSLIEVDVLGLSDSADAQAQWRKHAVDETQ